MGALPHLTSAGGCQNKEQNEDCSVPPPPSPFPYSIVGRFFQQANFFCSGQVGLFNNLIFGVETLKNIETKSAPAICIGVPKAGAGFGSKSAYLARFRETL